MVYIVEHYLSLNYESYFQFINIPLVFCYYFVLVVCLFFFKLFNVKLQCYILWKMNKEVYKKNTSYKSTEEGA